MPRDVVVTLVRTQICQVLVKNVPDNVLDYSMDLTKAANRSRFKDWEESGDPIDVDQIELASDVEDSEWLPEVDYNV
jgi:hypothetical protein